MAAGEPVQLDARPTVDRDDNALDFTGGYNEAGTYCQQVVIDNPENETTRMFFHANAAGKTIPVICQVKDRAYYPMTRY